MADYGDVGDHIEKQTRGWLGPYLAALDSSPVVGTGRWAYWTKFCTLAEFGILMQKPIPQIPFTMWDHDLRFESELLSETPYRHIKRILEPGVSRFGRWYDDLWLDFQKWLLHGFGRHDLSDDMERIPADLRNWWYTQFNLAYLLQLPIDWPAQILQGAPPCMNSKGRAKWANSTGFFSTPMNVATMMAQMLFATEDDDTRLKTVCDPCCGTGSLLLPASNYSLRLFGVDIVPDLCLSAELNGWLWMPWLVTKTPAVARLFDAHGKDGQSHIADGDPGPAPAPSGIRLETEPARVKAAQTYRAGEMSQADFFDAMGIKQN